VTSLRYLKSALAQPFSFVLFSVPLAVLGCGGGSPANAPMAGPLLRGGVHGGQQPVSGATIKLYAAGVNGYATGATSLLTSSVTSDANGLFTITGQYTCPTASSQLYILATGGNPGLAASTNNASLALMAALGPCSLHGLQYTLDPNLFINIDEATTVAAAYALSGFIDPSTGQIGASATNSIGIANAFQTASNIVDITPGQARTSTPAGNGTVPQAKINTLADILSPCVNSAGNGPDCAALFAAATPSGGTAPTNTLQAVINIAAHPAQQVGTLFALSPPTPPFQPTLAAAPNDWTLAVDYTGGGLSNPRAIAIDSSGDIWLANNGSGPNTSSVTEFSNTGAILSGANGYTSGSLRFAIGIAIDLDGNAWVPGYGSGGSVVKFSSSGAVLSGTDGFTAPTMDFPRGIAIDSVGNAWIPTYGAVATANITKLGPDGAVLSGALGYTAGTMNSPYAIAIDTSQSVWIPNINDQNVTKMNNTGGSQSGSTGFTGGGLNADPAAVAIDASGNAWIDNAFTGNLTKLSSAGAILSGASGFPTCVSSGPPASCSTGFSSQTVAIDGSGNAWAPLAYQVQPPSPAPLVNYFGLTEMDNSGTIVSGPTGYNTKTSLLPFAIAIDSSGNVWSVSPTGNIVTQLIGAATPVLTPLSVAAKDAALGKRP
jgi:hypothetical protein